MKTLTKLILATAVVAALAPSAANARCYGCGIGAGFVGGAIVGAAIASQPYAYAPPPVYAQAAYGQPTCYIVRKRVIDQYGMVRKVPVQVCQ